MTRDSSEQLMSVAPMCAAFLSVCGGHPVCLMTTSFQGSFGLTSRLLAFTGRPYWPEAMHCSLSSVAALLQRAYIMLQW